MFLSECQKEDWGEHKKSCGKQKVTKRLPGTVRDPFWKYPDVPDHLRDIPVASGGVQVTSIGFGTPHPSRPHNRALQRQVSMLTGDKLVDYFLFDQLECPMGFVILDTWTKISFRILRSDAMFSEERKGIEALAEYLVKKMQGKPGLSRERILAQMSREYDEDMAEKLAAWEKLKQKRESGTPGTTFIEEMSRNLGATLPALEGNI